MAEIMASNDVQSPEVSVNCLKIANRKILTSGAEHFKNFANINPYLMCFKERNPGFQYKIETDVNNNFQRLAVLMSYSVLALPHCFQVVGVDAAFLDGYELKGDNELKELRELTDSLPEGLRIAFKKGFLSAISGRTLENKMILFAFCIGYSECIEDYSFLFKFLNDNKVYLSIKLIKSIVFSSFS